MGVPIGYEPTAVSIGRAAFNKDSRALLVDIGSASEVVLVPGGMTLLADDRVTVDDTAGGKTLAQLLGRPLEAAMKRLVCIPASSGVYRAFNAAASAASPWLPAGGLDEPIGKTDADKLAFFAAASIDLCVRQYG